MCIYIYLGVHMYILTYVHIYIYTYPHMYIYTYIQIYIYTNIYIYVCACIYIYISLHPSLFHAAGLSLCCSVTCCTKSSTCSTIGPHCRPSTFQQVIPRRTRDVRLRKTLRLLQKAWEPEAARPMISFEALGKFST